MKGIGATYRWKICLWRSLMAKLLILVVGFHPSQLILTWGDDGNVSETW